jgi:hypothetical protein
MLAAQYTVHSQLFDLVICDRVADVTVAHCVCPASREGIIQHISMASTNAHHFAPLQRQQGII